MMMKEWMPTTIMKNSAIGRLIGDQPTPPLAQRLFAELNLTHSGEPTSYEEAKDDPD
jgi:hypothetical protein